MKRKDSTEKTIRDTRPATHNGILSLCSNKVVLIARFFLYGKTIKYNKNTLLIMLWRVYGS